SNLSTGNLGSVIWDFGDGDSSTVFSPTHTYALGGDYNICLTIKDTCGERMLCKRFTATCIPATPVFSQTSNLLQAQFTDMTPGNVMVWAWDFGDGNTSSQQNPTHTYQAVGNYNVCLIATSDCGIDSVCSTISITCPALVASFGNTNNFLQANFTDMTSGQASSWLWSFGDGSTSTLQNPTHVYQSAGSYTVCLQASDGCNMDSTCTTVVVCAASSASYNYTANSLQVDFTDASQGLVVSWAWDFGDGNSSALQSPSHTYATGGVYNACLITTDDCSVRDTFCQSIGVVAIDLANEIALQIYPNPNPGLFWIQAEFGQVEELSLQVFDLTGRALFAQQMGAVSGAFREQVDLSSLAQGSYILQLDVAGQRLNRLISISK
ncbi:MAG TPA: PKD domain-containing protein, partial [Bacteroidetes bacterium]|nr:PKD domain-containing protein [Bacteroidota bacterium]